MATKKKSKKKVAKKSAKKPAKKAAKKKAAKKPAKKAAKKKASKKAAANKVGRPPLPKKDLRSNVFCVRLRDDERKLIDKAAAKKGMSATDWAIQKLLKGL